MEISGVPFGDSSGEYAGHLYAEQGVGTITTVIVVDCCYAAYTYTVKLANLANLAISPPDDFSGEIFRFL